MVRADGFGFGNGPGFGIARWQTAPATVPETGHGSGRGRWYSERPL